MLLFYGRIGLASGLLVNNFFLITFNSAGRVLTVNSGEAVNGIICDNMVICGALQ